MHAILDILAEALYAIRYLVIEGAVHLGHELVVRCSQPRTRGERVSMWLGGGLLGGAAAGISAGSGLALIYHGVTWHNMFLLVPSLAMKAGAFGAVAGLIFCGCAEWYWHMRRDVNGSPAPRPMPTQAAMPTYRKARTRSAKMA
jgi:hypothetical protein